MPSIINLSPISEHTLTELLNDGNKTEMGIIMRSWVKHNNLEDMNDLLIHDLNDFTPTGSLSQYKVSAEAEETKPMPITPLKELYNLYRYIQHLILESEFDHDDEEFDNSLEEANWLLQARGKYMRYVIYNSSTATEPREPDWAIDPNENFQFDPNFDEFGDYVNISLSILDILDETSKISPIHNLLVNKHIIQQTPVDYEKLRPFFGWVNSDIVKQTIDQTTQWGVTLDSFHMKKHLKSRNPALNVSRRHEPVATDMIFSDTPAVDSGVKQAQVFVGRDSLVADVYPMKSGKQFVNTLEYNIRRSGVMDKLLSYSAKIEISKKLMDVLRAYNISNWHSEPYHPNQNPAEW